jgi:hypothetical protein
MEPDERSRARLKPRRKPAGEEGHRPLDEEGERCEEDPEHEAKLDR